jgi:hypothetical protein
MQEKDLTQYTAILKGLNECLGGKLPPNFSREELVTALMSKKITDSEGHTTTLQSTFQFGIFADCMNEGLILGDLQTETTHTKEERSQFVGDVYVYTGSTTNTAVAQTKTYGVGVMAGGQ